MGLLNYSSVVVFAATFDKRWLIENFSLTRTKITQNVLQKKVYLLSVFINHVTVPEGCGLNAGIGLFSEVFILCILTSLPVLVPGSPIL